MFLLIPGRHVGAHPHGVSIQISINLGKKFGESLCIFTFFLFLDSGLDLLHIFDFNFDLF